MLDKMGDNAAKEWKVFLGEVYSFTLEEMEFQSR